MFPFVDISNIVSPSMDCLIDENTFSLLSPILGLPPSVNLGETSESTTSSAESSPTSPDSDIAPNTPKTAPGPVRRKRQRTKCFCCTETTLNNCKNSHKTPHTPKTPGAVRNKRKSAKFCKVCQKFITEEGKRNQGPRRHILQHHLYRPLFFCPHCPATSNYDKSHISNHIQRIHKDLGGKVIVKEKHTYAVEYNHWFKRCFEDGFDSSKSAKNEVEPEAETDDNDDSMEASTTHSPLDLLLFSIDIILSP